MERRFLVKVSDCVYGETVYPVIPWTNRLAIDRERLKPPVRKLVGRTIEGEPVYETTVGPADIPHLNRFQVVFLVQRMLDRERVDRIIIKAI